MLIAALPFGGVFLCKMKTSEQSGVFLLEKYMTTKYEVDDIVILTGKIRSIEIFKEGVYYVMEGGIDKDGKTVLIPERLLLGRFNIDGNADN